MKRSIDVDQLNGNDLRDNAKQLAKSAVATVQEGLQSGASKTRETLLVGLGATQGLLKDWRRQKRMAKNLARAQKKAQKNLKKVQRTVQKSLQSGVSNTQDALQTGLGVAQVALERNVKRVNKNLKKAQKNLNKNLKNLQGPLQENLQTGLSRTQDVLLAGLDTTQDVLGKNAKRATKNLKKAQENLKDKRDTLQTQLVRRARRRRRARTIFRLGLLTGIVLVLLYTPWPGSETRNRIMQSLQGLFARQ
jgi:hypothetical protein